MTKCSKKAISGLPQATETDQRTRSNQRIVGADPCVGPPGKIQLVIPVRMGPAKSSDVLKQTSCHSGRPHRAAPYSNIGWESFCGIAPAPSDKSRGGRRQFKSVFKVGGTVDSPTVNEQNAQNQAGPVYNSRRPSLKFSCDFVFFVVVILLRNHDIV